MEEEDSAVAWVLLVWDCRVFFFHLVFPEGQWVTLLLHVLKLKQSHSPSVRHLSTQGDDIYSGLTIRREFDLKTSGEMLQGLAIDIWQLTIDMAFDWQLRNTGAIRWRTSTTQIDFVPYQNLFVSILWIRFRLLTLITCTQKKTTINDLAGSYWQSIASGLNDHVRVLIHIYWIIVWIFIKTYSKP